VFLRATLVDKAEPDLIETGGLDNFAIRDLTAEQVHPLRRRLLKSADKMRKPNSSRAPALSSTEVNPSAMIIIPTRDQVDVLGRCLAAIFARTSFHNFSIIIVDNESIEAESKKFFKGFFGDKIVSVSHAPGPYNHSALCNAGASRRRPDVLVFLKNNVEILSEDWLTKLVAHALQPGAGAVGNTPLYHGKNLQDAAECFMPYGQNVHEITAVSGDCLAISRRKFFAADGFDAVNLPNAFNDIDFCLRLREKGWISRADPAIRLLRHNVERPEPTSAECEYFRARWREYLRNDPYFHPGLSLYRAMGGE
jgi:GT2 family glycosyltransferase